MFPKGSGATRGGERSRACMIVHGVGRAASICGLAGLAGPGPATCFVPGTWLLVMTCFGRTHYPGPPSRFVPVQLPFCRSVPVSVRTLPASGLHASNW